jgi:arylsulfatase A-like enzyme
VAQSWRDCLVFTESARVEKTVRLDGPAQLVFAVAAEFAPGAHMSDTADFRLFTDEAQDKGHPAYACEWTGVRAGDGKWKTVSVPLTPGGDGSAKLSFEVVVNGRQGTAPAVLVSDPRLQPSGSASRPNVLIWTIDALRRDYVGLYGCRRGTTPFLDELAKECVVFDDAYAQSCWTKPSVAAMLTGLYPGQLGTLELERLPSAAVTLPEMLGAAGYATAAFLTMDVIARPVFNFDQGYDLFKEEGPCHGELVRTDLLAWLDQERPAPFFAHVHTFEVHAPYNAPGSYLDRFVDHYKGRLPSLGDLTPADIGNRANLSPLSDADVEFVRARYAGKVLYADAVLQRLVAALKERGLWDDLLFIALADHGEEFGEHGKWSHHQDMYPESVRIPLLIKLPGGRLAGTRVAAPASHVDIVPTVLSMAGVPAPQGLIGTDLFGGAATGPAAVHRPHVAHFWEEGVDPEPEPHPIPTVRHFAVATAGMYYMRSEWIVPVIDEQSPIRVPEGSVEEHLFMLADDPGAQRDVLSAHQKDADRLRDALKKYLAAPAVPADGKTELDKKTLDGLKQLGYL